MKRITLLTVLFNDERMRFRAFDIGYQLCLATTAELSILTSKGSYRQQVLIQESEVAAPASNNGRFGQSNWQR